MINTEEFICNNKFVGRNLYNFVYFSRNIQSQIYITKNGRTVNGKSILGLLSLDIKEKDIVSISCDGQKSEFISILEYLAIEKGIEI